jgi:hypothetical protein
MSIDTPFNATQYSGCGGNTDQRTDQTISPAPPLPALWRLVQLARKPALMTAIQSTNAITQTAIVTASVIFTLRNRIPTILPRMKKPATMAVHRVA